MNLLNIFKMIKADRYTQDGRDKISQLIHDQRRTYNPGDISPNTGLEKQDDGSWAPPEKEADSTTENKKDWDSLNINQKKEVLRAEFSKFLNAKGMKKAETNLINTKMEQNLDAYYKEIEWYKEKYFKPSEKKTTESKAQTKATPTPKISKPQPSTQKPVQNMVTKSKPPLTGETKIKITPAMKAELQKVFSQPAAKPSSETKENSVEKPTVTNGFESWQGIKELNKKLQPKWQQLKSKLKDSEWRAIEDWQQPMEGDKYRDIQAFTRDPVNYSHMKGGHQIYGLTKEQVEGIVKNLDSTFKKAPAIGTNLTVVSGQGEHNLFFNSWGIKEKNLDKYAEALKKHKGETLTNKSYFSASVNEKGAEGWHKDPIEVRIDVPKDKKAIYLGNMWDDDYIGTDPEDDGKENELFINRGAKYRLDDVKIGRNRAGKKAVLVKMTLVGDGTEK